MSFVFTYGTLKEGFANFAVNDGRRVPGEFETVERFPLYTMGAYHIPWLVDRPGTGEHVAGQLFEVSAQGLAAMDRLECLNEPGWFTRRLISIRPCGMPANAIRAAIVYFGAHERLARDGVHAGPLRAFTEMHDQIYRRHA